jgi:hypothetical protein
MNTHELVQAASAIAGPMAAQAFGLGNIPPGRIQEIASAAVEIAREIENQARRAPPREEVRRP